MSLHITLVGNPNTGKTTLFNKLAGTRQKVGNWSGVTVECKTGYFQATDKVAMTDLPGIYSFANETGGADEWVARRFLKGEQYDVIINVVDATNLKRNLKLTAELARLNRPMIVVLTMTDLAESMGQKLDLARLAFNLGVPVIDGQALSIKALQSAIEMQARELLEEPFYQAPRPARQWLEGVIETQPLRRTMTDKIDTVVLNPWLGIPLFLFAMYAMFAIAIGVGSLFIDPIDALAGYWFVTLPSHWLSVWHAPDWLITILANGIGGGIQLVAGFIPVIGFLYLCLSILEDSGYMARAAFIVDRLMMSIGLPGQAFIPLLLGFGCNVPSIMATRSLTNTRQRMLTMAMAPFMSCGARLAVYAMFVAVFFKANAGLIVFGLYLMGIVVAVGTAWLFRKQLFHHVQASVLMEMPHYHRPRLNNVGLSSWHKIKGFVMRAGKTIVMVSAVLTVLNAVPSWRGVDEGGKVSALAEVGQVIAPVFEPIGMGAENWPAAVGVFTGVLAKEAVVGTMDALYSSAVALSAPEYTSPLENLSEVGQVLWRNLSGIWDTVADPLGLASVGDATSQTESVTEQQMLTLFSGWQGAFAYLVFILLYTPCAATIGALVKEGGMLWTGVIVAWSTSIAYIAALLTYQLLTISAHWIASLEFILAGLVTLVLWIVLLKYWIRPRLDQSIIAVG